MEGLLRINYGIQQTNCPIRTRLSTCSTTPSELHSSTRLSPIGNLTPPSWSHKYSRFFVIMHWRYCATVSETSYPAVTITRNTKIKPGGCNLDQSASGSTLITHNLTEGENIGLTKSCSINSVQLRTRRNFTCWFHFWSQFHDQSDIHRDNRLSNF